MTHRGGVFVTNTGRLQTIVLYTMGLVGSFVLSRVVTVNQGDATVQLKAIASNVSSIHIDH